MKKNVLTEHSKVNRPPVKGVHPLVPLMFQQTNLRYPINGDGCVAVSDGTKIARLSTHMGVYSLRFPSSLAKS